MMQLFRGRQHAWGWVISPPIPHYEARGRILANWSSKDRVMWDGENYIHLFSQARDLRSESAWGQLLVRHGSGLATSSEGAPIPPHHIRLWRYGVCVEVSERELQELNPSEWIALEPTFILPTQSLGLPPPAPEPPVERAPINLRSVAGVPPASANSYEKLKEAVKQLRGTKPGPEGRASWRKRWLQWLQGTQEDRLPPQNTVSSGSNSNLSERFQRWWLQALFRLGLHRALMNNHQRVLDDLVEKFRSGQLEDALKMAIPLGTTPIESTHLVYQPKLKAREQLSVSPPSQGNGSTILGEDSQLQNLRRHYWRAFEQLRLDGRIKEAAFVRAELLGEKAEAVSFLERERAFQLAAEMADTLQLRPELRARLWMRAGDTQRAIEITQRHKVFGAVYNALKERDRSLARQLAMEWAEHLASLGDYMTAIEVSPADPQTHRSWFEAALKLGGTSEARILPYYLSTWPEALTESKDRIEDLLGPEPTRSDPVRLRTLGQALLHITTRSPVRSALSAHVVRALLTHGLHTEDDRRLIRELINKSEDPLLSATYPRKPALQSKTTSPLSQIDIDRGDRGRHSVEDAVCLESGRWLVAQGEGGLALYDPTGQLIMHRPIAAKRLVMTKTSHRCLILNRRGGRLTQVSEFDLISFAIRPLADLELHAYAPSYDGVEWAVSLGAKRELVLLHIRSEPIRMSWRSRSEGAFKVSQKGQQLQQLRQYDDALWLEAFDLGQDRLKDRKEIKAKEASTAHTLLPNYGRLSIRGQQLEGTLGSARWSVTCAHPVVHMTSTEHEWVWNEYNKDLDAIDVRFCTYKESQFSPLLRFYGSRHVGAHHHGGLTTFFDNLGRVEAFRGLHWAASLRA